MARVRSVTAPAMAGRSWRSCASTGTGFRGAQRASGTCEQQGGSGQQVAAAQAHGAAPYVFPRAAVLHAGQKYTLWVVSVDTAGDATLDCPRGADCPRA